MLFSMICTCLPVPNKLRRRGHGPLALAAAMRELELGRERPRVADAHIDGDRVRSGRRSFGTDPHVGEVAARAQRACGIDARRNRRVAEHDSRSGGALLLAQLGEPRDRHHGGLHGHEQPGSRESVLLGGDNGLRGYPLRYQAGESRSLLSLGERFFTDFYPWRLFRVGYAAFLDVGRVSGMPRKRRRASERCTT